MGPIGSAPFIFGVCRWVPFLRDAHPGVCPSEPEPHPFYVSKRFHMRGDDAGLHAAFADIRSWVGDDPMTGADVRLLPKSGE